MTEFETRRPIVVRDVTGWGVRTREELGILRAALAAEWKRFNDFVKRNGRRPYYRECEQLSRP